MSAKLKFLLLSVVCVVGFTSLSFELIILRQMVNFVGSNAIITSIVMAVILLFLSLGYYIGSVINFRLHHQRNNMIRLLDCLCIWYALVCSYGFMESVFRFLFFNNMMAARWNVFIYSLLFLSFPSVVLGYITSVIGRFVHHFNANYTGRFMAVDTIGSVTGSLLTTLVLMPFLGMNNTILFLCCLTAGASFALAAKRQPVTYGIKLLFFIGLAFFILNYKIMPVRRQLIKDDAISRMEVLEQTEDDVKYVRLFINGQNASAYSEDENKMFGYIKFINKNFINTLPQNKKHDILVLGAGIFTVGVNDKRNNYTYVDIEKNLPEVAEKYFFGEALPENKEFVFAEAYLYMLKNQKQYDIIVVDLYSAVRSIPENFVTKDFFEMVKKHLKPGGIMIANIITSPSFTDKFSLRIDNTLREVFTQGLSRQIIQDFNPYERSLVNVIYFYADKPLDKTVYTLDKNSSAYGQDY